MNLQNIKQKLEKVNRFYTYLEDNEDIISKIDRDSLMDFVRDLYNACFDDNATSAQPVIVEKIVEKIVEVPVEKVTVTETQQDTESKKKAPIFVFNNEETNTQKVEKATEVMQESKTIVSEKTVEKVPEKTVEKVIEKVVEKVVEKEEPISTTSKSGSFNEDYEELFMFKAATDLSQKLSEAPLKDLNKALGLNEKFVYINELFAGDVAKFQTAIKVFNDGGDFDNVRAYMEANLIEEFKWMDKAKKTVAKDFVKLVRRRYL